VSIALLYLLADPNTMKFELPFLLAPFLLQSDCERPAYLHQQAWLAIEVPNDSYYAISKSNLSVIGKECKILYHPRLKHVNTIHLIRSESTQVSKF
jgi:hypothetical protein